MPYAAPTRAVRCAISNSDATHFVRWARPRCCRKRPLSCSLLGHRRL